jgi:hypothetical protein
VKAKVRGYASGEGKTFSDGSRRISYAKGPLRYEDRYFGSDPFIGAETVKENGKPTWGMSYYGMTLDNKKARRQIVYRFLRKALAEVSEEDPFRGPESFKEGTLEYVNHSQGGLEGFTGTEKILYRGRAVYILSYNGGFVK